MAAGKRRVRRRYEPQERNIRKIFNVYNDGSESVAGYHVRVGGDDHGTFPNITQARAERDRAKADDLRGQRVRPGAGRVLLRDVVEEWLSGPQVLGAKPLTRSGYQRIARNRLAPLHGRPVRLIGKNDVKTFVGVLVGEGLAPATVGHVLFVLKSVMETAVDSGYIASNPCHGVKRPSMKRKPLTILGHSQVDAIVAATHEPWDLLVLLAAHSGLRAGELAGLRVRNLNPLRGSVTVQETVYANIKHDGPGTPKSQSAYRTVDELPRDLVDRLAAQVEGWPPDAYLFGGNGRRYDSEHFAFAPSAKPYDHSRFYRQVFLPTVRGLGIPVRFHDLRHYHASAVLEAGLPVPYVAKRLGHANAQMILTVYGHVLEGQGVGLADRLAEQRASAQVRRIG